MVSNKVLVSPARLSHARRESGQIPFTDSCLTHQEFLDMLIDLASMEVLPFRTRPIYVHTYFIRCPAAEYATPKPYGNLTRLSPPRVRVWPGD